MTNSRILQWILTPCFVLISNLIFSQAHTQFLQGEWKFEKIELEKEVSNGSQVQKDLAGIFLNFQGPELVIFKKTSTGDSILKRGLYSVDGDKLVIGKDRANIVRLDQKQFVVRIPREGLLYLRKS